jgi:hypothetical protein
MKTRPAPRSKPNRTAKAAKHAKKFKIQTNYNHISFAPLRASAVKISPCFSWRLGALAAKLLLCISWRPWRLGG